MWPSLSWRCKSGLSDAMSSKACELGSHPCLLRQADGSCKSDFCFCHFVRGLEEIGRVRRVPQKAWKGATHCHSLLPVIQAWGTLTPAELHRHKVVTARALPGQSPTKEPPWFKHGHHWLSTVSVLPSSERGALPSPPPGTEAFSAYPSHVKALPHKKWTCPYSQPDPAPGPHHPSRSDLLEHLVPQK